MRKMYSNFAVMEDEFELPVTFDKQQLHFTTRLLNYGYSYKLEVDIEGTKVLFEPDEERSWRALISHEDVQADKKLNTDLLRAVTSAIEEVLK